MGVSQLWSRSPGLGAVTRYSKHIRQHERRLQEASSGRHRGDRWVGTGVEWQISMERPTNHRKVKVTGYKEASHSQKGIQTCWCVGQLQEGFKEGLDCVVQELSLAGLAQRREDGRTLEDLMIGFPAQSFPLSVQGARVKAYGASNVYFFPRSWPLLSATNKS